MQATTEPFDDPDTARRAAALEHYRRQLAGITDPADLFAGRPAAMPGLPPDPVDAALEREAELLIRLDETAERLFFWRNTALALGFLVAAQFLGRWLP